MAAKFVENEFEKVDRLMELYERYEGRVLAEERRLGTSGEEYSDEEVLLARMDAGLYTLQQVPPTKPRPRSTTAEAQARHSLLDATLQQSRAYLTGHHPA